MNPARDNNVSPGHQHCHTHTSCTNYIPTLPMLQHNNNHYNDNKIINNLHDDNKNNDNTFQTTFNTPTSLPTQRTRMLNKARHTKCSDQYGKSSFPTKNSKFYTSNYYCFKFYFHNHTQLPRVSISERFMVTRLPRVASDCGVVG